MEWVFIAAFLIVLVLIIGANIWLYVEMEGIVWLYMIYSLLHVIIAALLLIPPWGIICQLLA